ncbi:MAG: arginine repressor [Candidatus Latescibacteria bacterium]|jgi:transcriptional regulator of arginine metabolism|nr:arginine repressor [Candidatus Latescibacterota bacterium]
MSAKDQRQQKILELISGQLIARQEELSAALKDIGISTTQSTLSKDIKELGIAKAPDGEGGFRYHIRGALHGPERSYLQGEELLQRELKDFVVGVDGAGYTVVVKTITGHAQGVCEAIDQVAWPEVVGTLAGENTIFILCRSEAECRRLRSRVEEMAG